MKNLDNLISLLTSEIQEAFREITFEELEEELRNFMKELGRKVLQKCLDRIAREKGYGYRGPVVEVNGREAVFERYEIRKIKTYFGEVSLKRAYYWFPDGEEPKGYVPLDEDLELSPREYSPSLEKGIAMVGIEAPFAKASRLLKELALVEPSPKTIEEITQEKGREVRKKRKEKAEESWKIFEGLSCAGVERKGKVEIRKTALPTLTSPPRRLYVQVDGGRVNTKEGWKEPKVGVIFKEESKVEVSEGHGSILEKEYIATLEGVEEFEKLMWEALLRWGVMEAEEVVLEGDGAEWIWNRIGGELCPGAKEVLDWAHAKEHLWKCGRAIFEEEGERERWAKEIEGLLLEGRVAEVIERLNALEGKEEVKDLIRYYESNKERMKYKEYIEAGIYIGSGAVESGVKNVVNARMKGCGMRWDRERAENMLHLRAEYLSGRWPS